KEVGKFGLVGILNTLLDIGILNVLKFLFNFPTLSANIISTSIATVNSYILNKSWTFKDKEKKWVKQFVVFAILSAIGIAINTTILKFLSEVWTVIPDFFVSVVHFLKLDGIFKDAFVITNSAKVFAIAGSMIWNFITYKKFAFNKKKEK
ncbi:GtrA family protein, partial [bacterium]|nr:GtrA family protein [bacterium]